MKKTVASKSKQRVQRVAKQLKNSTVLAGTSEVRNDFGGLLQGLALGATFLPNNGGTAGQLSQTDSQYLNLRYYLISNNRQLLSQMYIEHGIIQTLIDQPVDDALRAGYDIKSGQLDSDETELLQNWMKSSGAWPAYQQATKWKRLFGGAGVMIITTQKGNTPFNMDLINEFSRIEFRAADMWELFSNKTDMHLTEVTKDSMLIGDMYNYYGKEFHPSRVLKLIGKEAPSFGKLRLRGWGMSECERIIRPLNSYMKHQDVVFDLLDEAKLDVYRIAGFNSMLINSEATQQVIQRVQTGNMLKNYNNAITMDMKDEYQQKVIAFTGLADMLQEIRQDIANAVKMPLTKLFGQSAKGFSSGEDDIENYNSMLESEIRAKSHDDVIKLLQIGCKKLFDFIPDDLQVMFKPLRELSAEDIEKVKDSQWKRTKEIYENGLMEDLEAKESINRASLTPAEIDEKKPADDPLSARSTMAIQKSDPKANQPAAKGKPKLKAVK
jgi:phage-related protein (TIGR01555 family)